MLNAGVGSGSFIPLTLGAPGHDDSHDELQGRRPEEQSWDSKALLERWRTPSAVAFVHESLQVRPRVGVNLQVRLWSVDNKASDAC